jgi:hypothetical protein
MLLLKQCSGHPDGSIHSTSAGGGEVTIQNGWLTVHFREQASISPMDQFRYGQIRLDIDGATCPHGLPPVPLYHQFGLKIRLWTQRSLLEGHHPSLVITYHANRTPPSCGTFLHYWTVDA